MPRKFPLQSVWCSNLNGKSYATIDINSQLDKNLTHQEAIRIPLWITENILRKRLASFESVTLLTDCEVTSINFNDNLSEVIVNNKVCNETDTYHTKFVVSCDGTHSPTRQICNIQYENLSEEKKVINILFEAPRLLERITLPKAILYYLLENKIPATIGLIDHKKGLWYSQIIYTGKETDISAIDIDSLINEVTVIKIKKSIISANFWYMQMQLASNFSYNDRIFLVGDSAHGFTPTGGLDLNTGFGDITNLAWKIAFKINNPHSTILETYEEERRPIVLRNLQAAENNARDMVSIKAKYPPEKDKEAFAKANAKLAKQHLYTLGLTMGYAYLSSPITKLNQVQSSKPIPNIGYTPTSEPGCFLPYKEINGKPIYNLLSSIKWNLGIMVKTVMVNLIDLARN